MDEKTMGMLDILADYDRTLLCAVQLAECVTEDEQCGQDTRAIMEGLIISIMLNKADPLIPESDEDQQQVMDAAEDIGKVLASLPAPLPLIHQVAIGYAVALSHSNWGWHPWRYIRDYLLEEDS